MALLAVGVRFGLPRFELDVALGVRRDVLPKVPICPIVFAHQFLRRLERQRRRILGDESQLFHLSQLL